MESSHGGTLKIEGASYAITVDAERRVIQDATVIVDGQRITHVGKAADLRQVAAERTIDASGGVITPAFTNGHMHISYAHAVRGLFPDDFVGRERLLEVFRLQSAMTEEEEYWTSLLASDRAGAVRDGVVRRSWLDEVSRRVLAGVCGRRLPRDYRDQPDRSAVAAGSAIACRRTRRCSGRSRSSAPTTSGWRVGCERGPCRFRPTRARRSCWLERVGWRTRTPRA